MMSLAVPYTHSPTHSWLASYAGIFELLESNSRMHTPCTRLSRSLSRSLLRSLLYSLLPSRALPRCRTVALSVALALSVAAGFVYLFVLVAILVSVPWVRLFCILTCRSHYVPLDLTTDTQPNPNEEEDITQQPSTNSTLGESDKKSSASRLGDVYRIVDQRVAHRLPVAFCAAFFVGFSLPYSNIIFDVGTCVAERLLYVAELNCYDFYVH